MAGADEQREITDKKNQGSPVDLPPSSDCYAEQPDDTFDSHARRAGNRFLRDDEGCKCIEPNSLSPIDQVSPCVFQPIKMRFHRDWSPHGYDRAVELFEKVSSLCNLALPSKPAHCRNLLRFLLFWIARLTLAFVCPVRSSEDKTVRSFMDSTIPDDAQLDPPIPFELGTMAFAGRWLDSSSVNTALLSNHSSLTIL
jgi:hypothetical protein